MSFNGAQFHLLVNHLPVVGFVFAVLALVGALLITSMDIKRFVLGVTVVVGFSSLPALWTGEPAEDVLRPLPGFEKGLIHEHEEAAEFATSLAVLTALAAAGALLLHYKKPESLQKTLPGVFVLALITLAAMAKTAHDGGKIRHPELVTVPPDPGKP